MKMTKRLLAVLLGVSILFTMNAFAMGMDNSAEINFKKISVDSVTTFDDGGKDYTFYIDGMANHYLIPPKGFNPVKASDEELRRYCFPPRPDSKTEEYVEWTKRMENYSGTPEPEITLAEGVRFADVSGSWAGYVGNGTDSSTRFYNQVQMDYTQPTVSAVGSGTKNLNGYWVGIGGYNSGKLVQAGTSTEGLNTHKAWYELLPHAPVYLNSLTINAGDSIHVYISFQRANGIFEYYIANDSTGNSASGYVDAPTSTYYDGTSAEWIVENASGCQLGNFGSIALENCKATYNTSSSADTFR